MTSNIHNESTLHQQHSFFHRFQDYLGEFVYGGIDGSITTFAVVAGAAGAELSSAIVLILGFANLLADGFSMSIGAYLSSKSEQENYEKHKKVEYWEVENLPEIEREEIREIFRTKGFNGQLLEQATNVICSDKDRWVDMMMKEELGMIKEQRSPFKIGAVTFISFLILGLIPLLIYVFDFIYPIQQNLFLIACSLTFLAFVLVGYLKSYVTQTSVWKGVLETLLLGVSAAAVAYFVGDFLEKLLG